MNQSGDPIKERIEDRPFKISLTVRGQISEEMLYGLGHLESREPLVLFKTIQQSLREELKLSEELLRERNLSLRTVDVEQKYNYEVSLNDEVRVVMDAYIDKDDIKFSGKIFKGDEIVIDYLMTMSLVSLATNEVESLPDWIRDIF